MERGICIIVHILVLWFCYWVKHAPIISKTRKIDTLVCNIYMYTRVTISFHFKWVYSQKAVFNNLLFGSGMCASSLQHKSVTESYNTRTLKLSGSEKVLKNDGKVQCWTDYKIIVCLYKYTQNTKLYCNTNQYINLTSSLRVVPHTIRSMAQVD